MWGCAAAGPLCLSSWVQENDSIMSTCTFEQIERSAYHNSRTRALKWKQESHFQSLQMVRTWRQELFAVLQRVLFEVSERNIENDAQVCADKRIDGHSDKASLALFPTQNFIERASIVLCEVAGCSEDTVRSNIGDKTLHSQVRIVRPRELIGQEKEDGGGQLPSPTEVQGGNEPGRDARWSVTSIEAHTTVLQAVNF